MIPQAGPRCKAAETWPGRSPGGEGEGPPASHLPAGIRTEPNAADACRFVSAPFSLLCCHKPIRKTARGFEGKSSPDFETALQTGIYPSLEPFFHTIFIGRLTGFFERTAPFRSPSPQREAGQAHPFGSFSYPAVPFHRESGRLSGAEVRQPQDSSSTAFSAAVAASAV